MENGCTAGVKALRYCFEILLDKHTDSRFTGRLMKIVGEIFRRDHTANQGKKSVYFSKSSPLLLGLVFNIRQRLIGLLDYQFIFSHTESRNEARVVADGLKIVPILVPGGATHFRILHHLSIISDFCYSEETQSYEPMSKLSGLSVIGYSDFIPSYERPDIDIVVSFPDGVIPSESDSVIQCFGVEFYQVCSVEIYHPIGSADSIMIRAVF
jgi:hypothetical protein